MKRYKSIKELKKVLLTLFKRSLNAVLVKDRKGIAFFLTPFGLIIASILILVVLTSVFGLSIFIFLNVFTFLGLALFISGLIALFKGMPQKLSVGLIIGGVALILLPMLFEQLQSLTLATVLP